MKILLSCLTFIVFLSSCKTFHSLTTNEKLNQVEPVVEEIITRYVKVERETWSTGIPEEWIASSLNLKGDDSDAIIEFAAISPKNIDKLPTIFMVYTVGLGQEKHDRFSINDVDFASLSASEVIERFGRNNQFTYMGYESFDGFMRSMTTVIILKSGLIIFTHAVGHNNKGFTLTCSGDAKEAYDVMNSCTRIFEKFRLKN